METKSNNRALVLFACCICIAYLLPYHVHPFRAFYNDWIVMLGVVILLAFQVEQKILQMRLPWIVAIPGGLVILVLLQTSHGMLTVGWDVALPVAYFIVASLAICLGANMAAGTRNAQALCYALAISHLIAGLLSAAIAALQFIGAESYYGYWVMQLPHGVRTAIRPFANVAQPNQLALLFCMSIASVWWLFQVGQIKKVTGILVTVMLLWGLVLTQSRIGWLILPIFSFLLWCWRRESGFIGVSVLVTASCIFLYIVLVLTLPYIAVTIGSSVSSPLDHVGMGARSERLVLLQQALHISLTYPLFGAGWYEFGPQQVAIGSAFSSGTYSQHAHNIVMNFAAEVGWPFTLLIFGAFLYWLYAGCFRRRISKEVGFATLFFSAVVIHSLVEFPLWYAYVLLPTALLMGMVHQQQFGSKSINLSRSYVAAACLIMSISLVAVAVDYRRLVLGFRALGWESLGLRADEGTTEKPDFTIFPQFYDYFNFAKTTARKGLRADEIADMERIMRRFGYAPVLMRMSLVYALNSRPDAAFKAMMTINRMHPGKYAEAYEAWKNLAESNPDPYSQIFKRLPVPERKQEKQQ